MSDFSAEYEKTQELSSLDLKIASLEELNTASVWSLLKSQNEEDAKKHLFEFAFFSLGHVQLQLRIYRLIGDNENAEIESKEFLIPSKKDYDSIVEKGDWWSIKAQFLGELAVGLRQKSEAAENGFDPNLKYRGVEIFSEYQSSTHDTEEQYRAWRDFVNEKIRLIPDKTEPYTHPDLDELKAKISSL